MLSTPVWPETSTLSSTTTRSSRHSATLQPCPRPRHVGMVPLCPAYPLAVGAKLRVFVKVGALSDGGHLSSRNVYGDDSIGNVGIFDRIRCRMRFLYGQHPIVCRRYDVKVAVTDHMDRVQQSCRLCLSLDPTRRPHCWGGSRTRCDHHNTLPPCRRRTRGLSPGHRARLGGRLYQTSGRPRRAARHQTVVLRGHRLGRLFH